MRTQRTLLNFKSEFKLAGFSNKLPAGAYELSAMDEETDTMLSQGWRRVSTLLRTPSVDRPTGMEQWTEVHPDDVDRALAHDLENQIPSRYLAENLTGRTQRPAPINELIDEDSVLAQQARLQSDAKEMT